MTSRAGTTRGAATFLGGTPAYLIAPVVLLLANAMVVGAARRVHATPRA